MRIEIPVLNAELYVFFENPERLRKDIIDICENGEQLFSELEWDYEYCEGKTVQLTDGTLFIWMPEVPNTIKTKSTLAHEIFHAVVSVMNNKDIPLSADTEEVCAYLISFLTDQIYTLFEIK